VALINAIRSGDARAVRQIVRAGLDPDAGIDTLVGGDVPLILAARLGNREVVQALLEAKPDLRIVDADGNSALFYAVDRGFRDIVRLLLSSHGRAARLDPYLFVAVNRGYPDILSDLLEAGAHPNVADGNQFSPIMYAAKAGRLDLITELLKHGADPDFGSPLAQITTQAGLTYEGVPSVTPAAPTALTLAVESGHAEIVEALLDAGAVAGGRTALSVATGHSQTVMINELRSSLRHTDPFEQSRPIGEVEADIGKELRLAFRRLDNKSGQANSAAGVALDDWEYLAKAAHGQWDPDWQTSLRFVLIALESANSQQDRQKAVNMLEQVAEDVHIKAKSCRLNGGQLAPKLPVQVATKRNDQDVRNLRVCSKPRIMEFVVDQCIKPFENPSTPANSSLVPGVYLISAHDSSGHSTRELLRFDVEIPAGSNALDLKPLVCTLLIDW
jgi:ankyrin repeat protein